MVGGWDRVPWNRGMLLGESGKECRCRRDCLLSTVWQHLAAGGQEEQEGVSWGRPALGMHPAPHPGAPPLAVRWDLQQGRALQPQPPFLGRALGVKARRDPTLLGASTAQVTAGHERPVQMLEQTQAQR